MWLATWLQKSRSQSINPFTPGNFVENHVLKLVEPFSGHCLAIKSGKLPQNRLQVVHFAAFWSRLLIQMQNTDRICADSKISRLAFSFRFSCRIFSFAGHLVGFISLGKVFGKAFRILRVDERKGRWVVEQDFHGNCRLKVTFFLSDSPTSLPESCSFWHALKDLFTLHKLADKVVLAR